MFDVSNKNQLTVKNGYVSIDDPLRDQILVFEYEVRMNKEFPSLVVKVDVASLKRLN